MANTMMLSFPLQLAPLNMTMVAPQEARIKDQEMWDLDLSVKLPPLTAKPLFRTIPPPTETPRNLLKDEARLPQDEFHGLNIVTADVVVAEIAGIPTASVRCTASFKLPTSKSPIMEAMVYCALHKWGIELEQHNKALQQIVFKVIDFEKYYRLSCSICSKQTPSEDIRSRMKALQRWFTSFPSRRLLSQTFSLTVKVRQFRKVHDIIEKVTKFVEGFSSDGGLDETI